jgi:hypothetical protein
MRNIVNRLVFKKIVYNITIKAEGYWWFLKISHNRII